ncbi:hypothetical protein MOJ79_09950 [Calidifontimicrobium sp. SYSU G02091]|uniref:BPSS1780 family membrane protein n=1 Tax=Calidifontimicrobium sp. SYSU G02091 TaxID=2926421 RepID=UPI001F532E01|nr:BPSS1780 family membrane protein [Calidifontimicrobium sp. SYSU G02091]MCI1192164.1 hypothetical protein [Calidifontimicrobium sp. SYSU G02091]
MALRLHTVAARQGLAWLRAAFATYAKRPLGLTMLFVVFLFSAILVLALPYVGQIVVMGSLPLLSLGYMIATRAVLGGGTAQPGHLVEGLRGDTRRRAALLQLSAVYALATVVILLLADAVDGGRFERVQLLLATPERTPSENAELDALLADDRLTWGLVVRFGLAALLAIPFWHAPALVHWGGQGVLQSLFSSTLAVWRNRGAMTVYVVAWVGMIALFSVAVGALFGLLGTRQLAGLVALPAGLMFTCVFYVSLYFTFVDVFGGDGADGRDALHRPPPPGTLSDS